MIQYFLLVVLFGFDVAHADELDFLTKAEVQQLIESAARDPKFVVTKSESGDVQINRRREPLSPSETPDPIEDSKAKSWQRMFAVGFDIGSSFVGPKTAREGRENDSDFTQFDLHFNFQAMMRMPWVRTTRLAIGAGWSAGNGQIFEYEGYPQNPAGVRDGLAPLESSAVSHATYFADYDVLYFPADEGRMALSAGAYWGYVRKDMYEAEDPIMYYDRGLQFKFRGGIGWGGVTPYVVLKLSNQRQHSISAGINKEFGARINRRPRVQK